MLLTVLSYIPVVIGSWLIGLLTLLKNTRAKVNIYFASFTFFMGLWLGMLFLGDASESKRFSLWAVRLATFFGALMIASLIDFAIVFPKVLREPTKLFKRANVVVPGVFMVLSLSPWLIPSVAISDGSAQPTNLGLIYTLQTVYAVGGCLLAVAIIVRKYRHVDVRAKAQIKLVAIGLLIALLINTLTGFVLTVEKVSNNYSNLVGSISFLIFEGATAYAIVKHRMFDIRLAIARAIGFIVTVGLVATIYSLLVLGIGALFIAPDKNSVRNLSQLLISIPPTIFVGLTFHWIQDMIAKATRRVFYQDTYDLKTVLDSISDTLITDSDIDKIMSGSLRVISEAIKPSHGYLAVFDENRKLYRESSIKSKISDETIFSLIKYIRTVKINPLVRDELFDRKLPDYFIDDDVALLLRLGTRDDVIGILVFGTKQNGRTYTADDIALLRISAKNLGIALDNAKKYDEISRFAETMHSEVLNATAKLRTANEELKTLDVMKDDFISMASHQLRTPATSVHEALQMLNHPGMPLSKEERVRLTELAEGSSEHLVTVVADMLSISRIQAGNFSMNKAELKMNELIERVIKQTAVLAEQKQIKLAFDSPKEPVIVMGDQAKINEAVSNYIENAIKYSGENTTVTVRLAVEKDKVIFEAIDEGIGVPEKEQRGLFSKFFRAGNARVEQPDGNGIGLFVVRSIANGHGGDAYYKPQDHGSLFGFWLPAKAANDKK